MATVSSHILDSISGKSAAGIRVELFQIRGEQRQSVFDIVADHEGRIAERVESSEAGLEHELVIHAADYFGKDRNSSAVSVVVIRFVISDTEKRYHLPVMLAPHSYSTWWSD